MVKWRRRVKRQCCLSPTWHMSIKIFPKFLQSKTTQWHPLFCFASRSEPSNKYTKIGGCSTVAPVIFFKLNFFFFPSHEKLFDFKPVVFLSFYIWWLWYYRFIWGYFDGFNIFMNINNKIIKILRSIKKNKGFQVRACRYLCFFIYSKIKHVPLDPRNLIIWGQECYGLSATIFFC